MATIPKILACPSFLWGGAGLVVVVVGSQRA